MSEVKITTNTPRPNEEVREKKRKDLPAEGQKPPVSFYSNGAASKSLKERVEALRQGTGGGEKISPAPADCGALPGTWSDKSWDNWNNWNNWDNR